MKVVCFNFDKTQVTFLKQNFTVNHVNGFSDLVDLWVIKIKKPMILCVRSTSK